MLAEPSGNEIESATKDVQVAVGKDLSTVVIGGTKVEVGSDGKKVTAYTNDGVEARYASAAAVAFDCTAKGTQISISEDFSTVVLNGVTIERAADGHLVISTPGGIVKQSAPANDTAAKATLEIGAIESTGE